MKNEDTIISLTLLGIKPKIIAKELRVSTQYVYKVLKKHKILTPSSLNELDFISILFEKDKVSNKVKKTGKSRSWFYFKLKKDKIDY